MFFIIYLLNLFNIYLQHDRSQRYERDIKTREEITSLIAHHVTAVNYIYRNTKFDGRTEHRNIRFEVSYVLLRLLLFCSFVAHSQGIY